MFGEGAGDEAAIFFANYGEGVAMERITWIIAL